MSGTTILAWHFTNGHLRDGSPLPKVGKWLRVDGPPRMCSHGLHASVNVLDALGYAPGGTLHRVRVGGTIIKADDKIAGTERKILWTLHESELEATYREFARWCALQVIDKWDAPDIVRRYLETGDESIRDAAGSAAWSAAWSAARSAARSAAWDAAGSAAWSAARSAAWSAAWDAA